MPAVFNPHFDSDMVDGLDAFLAEEAYVAEQAAKEQAKKADIADLLQRIMHDHIVSHHTNGDEWPDDAEFCVSYRVRAWPTNFGPRRTVFFATQESMDAWIEDQRKWASLEDNWFDGTVMTWDWGPKFVRYVQYFG